MSILPSLCDEAQEYLDNVNARLQEEADKPLFVAVMGQTGVGKSTLINALFDTELPTDPVRPCTMEPIEVTVNSTMAGHPLRFVDLPGVGESATADPRYLKMYRHYLDAADVAIWAMHADSRSLAADGAWIQQLTNNDASVVNKITFVLTKADTSISTRGSCRCRATYLRRFACSRVREPRHCSSASANSHRKSSRRV
jgi:predicted GTPase